MVQLYWYGVEGKGLQSCSAAMPVFPQGDGTQGMDGVLEQCILKGGEGHGGRTTAPNGNRLELLEMRCFLRTVASTLVAHWHCLSSFKNIGTWVSPPEIQIIIWVVTWVLVF